jgi:hypothetical protein
MGMQFLLLLGLGSHSKQTGDEGDLPSNVSFAHPSDLPLANHVHNLVSLQRSPCRFNRKEAHPWLDQPLDKTDPLCQGGGALSSIAPNARNVAFCDSVKPRIPVILSRS